MPIHTGPEITLPRLQLRPWGLFTQVVDEYGPSVIEGYDRSLSGAQWINRDVYSYGVVKVTDACDLDDEDDLLANEISLANEGTVPFQSFNSLTCTVIGGLDMPEINAMLKSDEEVTRSAGVVLGLTTVVSADHINLPTNSTSLGAGTDIIGAVGLIEDGLADRIANAAGYIFVPPRLLAAAFANNVVFLSDGQLRSPCGHRVISDAGHRPENTLYGTGALTYRLGEARKVENPGGFTPATNKLGSAYVRYAWVAFNPEHSVRATV